MVLIIIIEQAVDLNREPLDLLPLMRIEDRRFNLSIGLKLRYHLVDDRLNALVNVTMTRAYLEIQVLAPNTRVHDESVLLDLQRLSDRTPHTRRRHCAKSGERYARKLLSQQAELCILFPKVGLWLLVDAMRLVDGDEKKALVRMELE